MEIETHAVNVSEQCFAAQYVRYVARIRGSRQELSGGNLRHVDRNPALDTFCDVLAGGIAAGEHPVLT